VLPDRPTKKSTFTYLSLPSFVYLGTLKIQFLFYTRCWLGWELGRRNTRRPKINQSIGRSIDQSIDYSGRLVSSRASVGRPVASVQFSIRELIDWIRKLAGGWRGVVLNCTD